MNELIKELRYMDMCGIKPNYAALGRKYEIDWRTARKYNNGYEGKSSHRDKKSILDDYKDTIKDKVNLPGSTIKGTYKYIQKLNEDIGSYSNFYKYVRKHKLKNVEKDNTIKPRFETAFGKQLQFDWKEDITMINKHGEEYQFNIFSATLGASRLHIYIYSKTKTREDVERCLVEIFRFIGGVPQEILTDNMSSIVNPSTKTFCKEFLTFAKDMGTKAKHCKVKSPETKGKVESSNRFANWLIPYNYEFEFEEEIPNLIKELTKEVNKEVNDTIGVSPLLLFEKEKEHLQPLPASEILDAYTFDVISAKVTNGCLVRYHGSEYSVPSEFINKTVKLRVVENKLHIYYNNDLIVMHDISNNKINYKEEHYKEMLMKKFNAEESEIEKMALKNLENLNRLTKQKEGI